MFSNDRPITSYDLEMLRKGLNLQHIEFCYIIGISQNKWHGMRTAENMRQPVKDVAIAILARWLFAFTQDCPKVARTTPDELYRYITEDCGIEMEERTLGIMFGRDPTALYRWNQSGSGVPPSIRHCIMILENGMNRMGQKKAINMWLSLVDVEAKARGIPDILKSGFWSAERSTSMALAEQNKRPLGRPRGSGKGAAKKAAAKKRGE